MRFIDAVNSELTLRLYGSPLDVTIPAEAEDRIVGLQETAGLLKMVQVDAWARGRMRCKELDKPVIVILPGEGTSPTGCGGSVNIAERRMWEVSMSWPLVTFQLETTTGAEFLEAIESSQNESMPTERFAGPSIHHLQVKNVRINNGNACGDYHVDGVYQKYNPCQRKIKKPWPLKGEICVPGFDDVGFDKSGTFCVSLSQEVELFSLAGILTLVARYDPPNQVCLIVRSPIGDVARECASI